jgi:hypothetical protein
MFKLAEPGPTITIPEDISRNWLYRDLRPYMNDEALEQTRYRPGYPIGNLKRGVLPASMVLLAGMAARGKGDYAVDMFKAMNPRKVKDSLRALKPYMTGSKDPTGGMLDSMVIQRYGTQLAMAGMGYLTYASPFVREGLKSKKKRQREAATQAAIAIEKGRAWEKTLASDASIFDRLKSQFMAERRAANSVKDAYKDHDGGDLTLTL